MTSRAIGGLFVFNAFLLVAGAGVLWGVRGWRWWTDFVRLAGVAYLLGLALLMIVLTLEIVLGVPVDGATIGLAGLVPVVAGIAVGRRRGHSMPALAPSGWHFPRLSLFAALFVAGIVVYLEGLVRSERLSGVVKEWDSWAFWMPKAEWIYYSGGLDPKLLAGIPSAPYPPGLTSVQAAAFHAMGSADTTTLHVQYWFFAVGFVGAIAGLLASRVPQAILFPVLLAVLVAPSLVARMTTTYADIPLGQLAAVAALLMALWLLEEKTWQLAAATLLLAGAMLTKREGTLFVVCILVGAFVASWRDRSRLWRQLAVGGAAAFALALPWRVWFTAQGIPGDGPESGYLGSFRHIDRAWPALKLVITTLFDQGLWPVAPILAVAAIVLAALAGATRMSVFAAVLLASAIVSTSWAIWSNLSLKFTQEDSANPIVRLTGTTVLTLAALTPVLLHAAWSGRKRQSGSSPRLPSPGPDALVARSWGAWAIVLLGVLSHPGAMLVGYSGSGLPGGLPSLPGQEECVSRPVAERPVRLVVGYADSFPEAEVLRRRAVGAGLTDVQAASDGCGRVRVFIDHLPIAEAQGLERAARAAALDPTLELDPNS